MRDRSFITLGIESSCDDTGVAIYSSDKGLIAHKLFSQTKLHAAYGGVVPELASRDHIQKVIPLIKHTINEANINISDISGIAYTAGPGLSGALLVGSAIAKSLAFGLGINALSINHMEGHLLAPFLEDIKPEFPFLALLVSGGHTMLVDAKGIGKYKILGESLDDAAGEAFDKTAKILGLGYPGGPALAKLAKSVDSSKFKFPMPMTNRPGLDFSFSGLKTFALNTFIKYPQEKANIAKAFEVAVVGTLVLKCKRALLQTKYNTLVVAGGVSSNKSLRRELNKMSENLNITIFYPRQEFCTDNGAMIALAGHLRMLKGQRSLSNKIVVKPKWSIEELTAV